MKQVDVEFLPIDDRYSPSSLTTYIYRLREMVLQQTMLPEQLLRPRSTALVKWKPAPLMRLEDR